MALNLKERLRAWWKQHVYRVEDIDVVVVTTFRTREGYASSLDILKAEDPFKIRKNLIRDKINEFCIPSLEENLDMRKIAIKYVRRITYQFGARVADEVFFEDAIHYTTRK